MSAISAKTGKCRANDRRYTCLQSDEINNLIDVSHKNMEGLRNRSPHKKSIIRKTIPARSSLLIIYTSSFEKSPSSKKALSVLYSSKSSEMPLPTFS